MANGQLASLPALEWEDGACVVVVLVSDGYPGPYEKGYPISLPEEDTPGVIAFHAGTKLVGSEVQTSGGRVLGITAVGRDLVEATELAYAGINQYGFDNKSHRRDIPVVRT